MTENLNNLFTDVENETPLNAPVEGNDGGLNVEIVNTANGARNRFTLYPETTLREILDVCKAANLFTDSVVGAQLNYEYNGDTYSDPNLTVEKIGIVDGSKLLIHPSGTVA